MYTFRTFDRSKNVSMPKIFEIYRAENAKFTALVYFAINHPLNVNHFVHLVMSFIVAQHKK